MLALYLSFAFTAVPLGAMYALQASGIVLVYRTTRVFNFAQAGIGVVAAFTAARIDQALGGGYPGAYAGAVVAVALSALIGVLIELTSVRYARGVLQKTIVTLGWLLALQSVIVAIFGNSTTLAPAQLFGTKNLFTIDYIKSGYGLGQLVTLLAAAGIAVGLGVFLSRTAFGTSMRAVADDPEAAALMGLPVRRVLRVTWGLGGAVAGLAGVLIAPLLTTLDNYTLFLIAVEAIAAALVGGLRSLPLTFAGGIGLAVLQGLAQVRFQGEAPIIGPLVAFLVVLAAVLARRRSGRADVSEGGLEPARVLALPPLRLSGPGFGVAAAVLVLVPLLFGSTGAENLSTLLAWGIAGLSVVLLTGVAGQVSVCQGVFMGVGALVAAIASFHGVPFLVAVPLGAVAAAAAAALVGIPALRLEPLELAIVTVAFAFSADGFLFQWRPFTQHTALPRPAFTSTFRHGLAGDRGYYWLVLGVFLALALGVAFLRRGRTGAALTAVRSSEAATAAMGLSVTATKLLGFALSGLVAGVAGGLVAGVGGGVSTGQVSTFDTTASITLLAYAIIAGVGSVPAAVFTGLLVTLPLITSHGSPNPHITGVVNVVSGVVLVAVVVLLPRGVAGGLSSLRAAVFGPRAELVTV